MTHEVLSDSDSRPDTVTFYQDKRNKWRWRKVAPNGRTVICSPQGYANREDAQQNFHREIVQGWKVIEE